MPKILSFQAPDDLANRLDNAAKLLKMSRNALLLGMTREKVEEIETTIAGTAIDAIIVRNKAIADQPVSAFTGFDNVPVVVQNMSAYDKLVAKANERMNTLRSNTAAIVPITTKLSRPRPRYDDDGLPIRYADED